MPSYHQNVCWPSEETDLFNSLVDQTSGWNTLFTNSIYENNLQKQLQNQHDWKTFSLKALENDFETDF